MASWYMCFCSSACPSTKCTGTKPGSISTAFLYCSIALSYWRAKKYREPTHVLMIFDSGSSSRDIGGRDDFGRHASDSLLLDLHWVKLLKPSARAILPFIRFAAALRKGFLNGRASTERR